MIALNEGVGSGAQQPMKGEMTLTTPEGKMIVFGEVEVHGIYIQGKPVPFSGDETKP